MYNPFVNPVHRSLFTNICKDITQKKHTETFKISFWQAVTIWHNTGSSPTRGPLSVVFPSLSAPTFLFFLHCICEMKLKKVKKQNKTVLFIAV